MRRLRLLLCVVSLVSFALAVYFRYTSLLSHPSLTPLDVPFVKNCPLFDSTYRREMLWGTYRPGLYFGLRMRLPSSLLAGLMWLDASHLDHLNDIRHTANQDDNVQYGWIEHNGRDYGLQTIRDNKAAVNITTAWVKRSEDWSVRISVDSAIPKEVALFFYLADEGGTDPALAKELEWKLLDERIGPHGQQVLTGKHFAIGPWRLCLHSTDLAKLKIYKSGFPVGGYHNLSKAVHEALYESLQYQYHQQEHKDYEKLRIRLHDPPIWLSSATEHPNFATVQVSGIPPFSFEVVFLHGEFWPSRYEALVGNNLDVLLKNRGQKFRDSFAQRWLNKTKRTFSDAELSALFYALSNLLGGIGYFYGASMVRVTEKNGDAPSVQESFDTELFTSVPSRSFFPRGFLWDEGFHLLLIQKWDPMLCKDILAHWLDLMSQDGWIAREQILGMEARSRVPDEFIIQDPAIGNPPTLFLPLAEIAAQNDSDAQAFLSAAWPRLVTWFDWIVGNHRGLKNGTYRWTSRTASTDKLVPLTLDSGLDDYPRASHPTPDEYHLDIRCWIAMAATAMSSIASTLGRPASEQATYSELAAKLNAVEAVRSEHYDKKRGWFSDYGLHAEGARLEKFFMSTPHGEEVRGRASRGVRTSVL